MILGEDKDRTGSKQSYLLSSVAEILYTVAQHLTNPFHIHIIHLAFISCEERQVKSLLSLFLHRWRKQNQDRKKVTCPKLHGQLSDRGQSQDFLTSSSVLSLGNWATFTKSEEAAKNYDSILLFQHSFIFLLFLGVSWLSNPKESLKARLSHFLT